MPWLKARALAKPNVRSSHSVPTPQGGGIVVVPAALVGAAFALVAGGAAPPGGLIYWGIVAAAALALSIISFVNDRRELGILPRLVGQIAAVAAAIVLMPAELRIASFIPPALERALLIVAALWFVNLFNFMDGIDLISATETTAIALGVALLATFGALPAGYG